MDPYAGLELLERRYARLLGKLKDADRGERISNQMAALQALIRSNFDPLWTSEHIAPILPQRRYEAAEVRRVLRQVISPFQPQTARQLAKQVVERLSDDPPTEQELHNLDRSIRSVLEREVERYVRIAGNTPARWIARSPDCDVLSKCNEGRQPHHLDGQGDSEGRLETIRF